MEVYADYAATSPMHPKALEAYISMARYDWGNPASKHRHGWNALDALESARERIAKVLNVPPDTIFFNSGGTEGNNQVICNFSSLWVNSSVIVSSIEHSSVIAPARERCDVSYLPVDNKGYVCLDTLEKWLSKGKYNLVSIVHTNNEIGTRQNVAEISRICSEHNVPLHMDCVQAIGHTQIDLSKVTIATASGHKFGAPKGIGFVYSQIPLKPLIQGGGQEYGFRSGTVNVPAAVAMAVALEKAYKDIEEKEAERKELSTYLICKLAEIGGHVNGDTNHPSGIINVRFDGIKSDELAFALNCRGIYVSTGSACSVRQAHASHVLQAIGLTDKEARESIRISIGDSFDALSADYIVDSIQKALRRWSDNK